MRSSRRVDETKLAFSTFSEYLALHGMPVAFSNFLRACERKKQSQQALELIDELGSKRSRRRTLEKPVRLRSR